MSVRKRPAEQGGGWEIDIGVRGWPRIRRTVPQHFGRRQAEALERQWRLDLEHGRWPFDRQGPKQRPPLSNWGELSARWWLRKGQHLASARDLKSILNCLSDAIGDETPIDALTTATFDNLAEDWSQTVGPDRINGRLSVVRRILNRARKVWSSECPPIPDIAWGEVMREIPDRDPLERYLDPVLRRMVIDHLMRTAPHAAWTLAILDETGMRAGSVFALDWDHVDLEAGIYRTKAKGRAGGRWIVKPISSTLRAIFEAIGPLEHGPVIRYRGLRIRSISTAMRAAKVRLGLAKFRMKDFRNSAAIEVLAAGGSLTDAQALLDHSDPALTHKHYGRLDVERVRRVMDRRSLFIAEVARKKAEESQSEA